MATAVLTVPAAPEHARTARLVAGAAARRAGVETDLIDDVRLAVAEAVGLAVTAATDAVVAGGQAADVAVSMVDDGPLFRIQVAWAPVGEPDTDGEELAVAVMESLSDELALGSSAEGRSITMAWSTGG